MPPGSPGANVPAAGSGLLCVCPSPLLDAREIKLLLACPVGAGSTTTHSLTHSPSQACVSCNFALRAGVRSQTRGYVQLQCSVEVNSGQNSSLQHMVDKQMQAGRYLYICFWDLKSAYDRVSRPVLWQILQRLGLHGNMLQAIQGLYGSATVAVKIGGRQGLPLVSVSGVAAGLPAQSHVVWTPCR